MLDSDGFDVEEAAVESKEKDVSVVGFVADVPKEDDEVGKENVG